MTTGSCFGVAARAGWSECGPVPGPSVSPVWSPNRGSRFRLPPLEAAPASWSTLPGAGAVASSEPPSGADAPSSGMGGGASARGRFSGRLGDSAAAAIKCFMPGTMAAPREPRATIRVTVPASACSGDEELFFAALALAASTRSRSTKMNTRLASSSCENVNQQRCCLPSMVTPMLTRTLLSVGSGPPLTATACRRAVSPSLMTTVVTPSPLRCQICS